MYASQDKSKLKGGTSASQSYWTTQLAPTLLLEIELLILAFAAGINDATTVADYGIFTSNQTGNTVLLAVGALRPATKMPINLPDIAFSLSFFMLGGFCSGQLGHKLGRTTRWWLCLTNAVQTMLVFTAAALREWVARDVDGGGERWIVISLLAFASGAQVAVARTVGVPEVTTAMVTSAYIDFLVDPNLLARNNRPRTRRGVFILALAAGSFVGAVVYREVDAGLALLMAGCLKLLVFVLLFLNRGPLGTEANV